MNSKFKVTYFFQVKPTIYIGYILFYSVLLLL